MEIGFDHQPMLSYAKRMLDRSGAGSLDSEQLKIEWYKLGTDFSFGVQGALLSFRHQWAR